MRATAVLAALLVALRAGRPAPAAAQWRPDPGNGRYTNPVLFADYSDPDVVRVGRDFYMTASSFGSVPALPILHSRDLVNWTIVNHAVRRLPPDFDLPQHGNGVWAPAIRHHRGEYYIYWGDPDRGIYMVKTRDVRGAWDAPVLVKAARGWIDPAPFWDDDGNAYLVHAFARSRSGIKHRLHVNRMSADGTRLLDEGTLVFEDSVHHPTAEGPKLYKRDGWYWIFAPAGGVATGWQLAMRSRSPLGPYEARTVLAQGRTAVNGPHQGAWVQLAGGEDWFVHFQDLGPYGRIVHLQPMTWKDGWPVIGADADGDGTGEPVTGWRKPDVGRAYALAIPQSSDDFAARELGLQWQWQANPQPAWFSLRARAGHLRLAAAARPAGARNLWDVPNLMLQKLPAPAFTATARVTLRGRGAGETAGLVVMGMDYAYAGVRRRSDGGREVVLARATDAHQGGEEQIAAAIPTAAATLDLRVEVAEGALCRFSYSANGRDFTPLGAPFQAREGRWIGAKVGLFTLRPADGAPGGFADVDFFRIR